ncbi:Predicted metal-dependent phosphoesterase TrpH, contains PHP domain [Halogranum rubrum]|uniref:Predicted metal-dependent phosphoesterase TrpH, contains PHP domain n=2 Tax=Halogranum rubrum TaxID=553466 RepID=A0A1I4EB54_9EURY|nr:Predicted metal-dependent phosphoesterase TrpH, contains PHP domain [Halogranum rubrum]
MTEADATRVDMHVKTLDEHVVRRAKARGLDVLVYAPHFVRLPDIRATAARYSDDELLVVPAREVFTGSWRDRRHLLAIGLTDPVPDFITLDGALREFDRQDAAVVVPHPELMNVSMRHEDVAMNRDAIDAVEIYNAKCQPYQNRRGQRIANTLDMPCFGSSYAHLRGTVGEAWTQFDTAVDDESDLVDALQANVSRRVLHRPGLSHRLRSLVEFSHLGFENSWGKFDRLLLSGMEPTHPMQVAYDGRFDDVSVY